VAHVDSAGSPTPLDTIVERERDGEVATALRRLPQRYREPLVLFYYEQCSVREVATALAMHESAAMQRLSRGRRKLGEVLATRVEHVLESRKTRAAVVAAVLLLLPARSASAATGSATAWLAARMRPIGAALGVGIATVVVVAGVSRSKVVSAKEAARDSASNVAEHAARPTPKLPDPEQDRPIIVTSPLEPSSDDPDHVYRSLSISSTTPYETCARGARGVAMAAFGNDAIRLVDGVRYYKPSDELVQIMDAAAARSGASCDGDEWPEVYVACEGTLADILGGTVSCYPQDMFHDRSPPMT
jgi:hypothetical protein